MHDLGMLPTSSNSQSIAGSPMPVADAVLHRAQSQVNPCPVAMLASQKTTHIASLQTEVAIPQTIALADEELSMYGTNISDNALIVFIANVQVNLHSSR